MLHRVHNQFKHNKNVSLTSIPLKPIMRVHRFPISPGNKFKGKTRSSRVKNFPRDIDTVARTLENEPSNTPPRAKPFKLARRL